MLTRSLLLGAAASLALGATANATTINGWYVGLEGGANWIDDWNQTFFTTNGVGVITDTNLTNTSFDTGWAVLATTGYGFGGGWRAEFEAGYRDNDSDVFLLSGAPFTASVDLSEVSLMVNVLYDIPLTQRISLSLGAGAGADYVMYDITSPSGPADVDEWTFAYQGIAGLNYAVGQQTALFVNYRYFRAVEPDFDFRPATPSFADGDDLVKHTVTLGLRYAFGQPAAEPMVAPPPPPPPPMAEPTTPREYIVFFGHNKTELTAEALDVVRQAATAAKEYGSASILVVGHADRSGSATYNEKLSLRRATVVKGALVSDGISAGSVTVSGRGESDPMVPTADGVREPQNRRVHISL
jgi:OmpA-OmpF porin, OOP family